MSKTKTIRTSIMAEVAIDVTGYIDDEGELIVTGVRECVFGVGIDERHLSENGDDEFWDDLTSSFDDEDA